MWVVGGVCAQEWGKEKKNTHTHTNQQMKRGFALIMRWIWCYPGRHAVFISLPPSSHNSPWPQLPVSWQAEAGRRRRRGAARKMERWRKREQPTDRIMVVASVIRLIQRETERLRSDWRASVCVRTASSVIPEHMSHLLLKIPSFIILLLLHLFEVHIVLYN